MPKITRSLITELIAELTALESVLPPDEADPILSTINLKRLITKTNNLNWALNHSYRHYPSFYQGSYKKPQWEVKS